jgi:hypothetical protein
MALAWLESLLVRGDEPGSTRKGSRLTPPPTRTLLPLLALVLLVGCARWEEPQRWRVTVEVETPVGLATGSGVVETHYRPRHGIIHTMDSPQRRVLGEAIAVDLPEGILFALLDGEGDYGFYRSQSNSFGWVHGPDGRLRRVQLYPSENTPEQEAASRANTDRHKRSRAEIKAALAERRPFTLLEEGWPRFILLPDPGDPKSAVALAPTETAEAAIGDIRVRRIIVQETDEPVTRTLAARLPWLTPDALPVSRRQVYPHEIAADGLLPDDFSTLLE